MRTRTAQEQVAPLWMWPTVCGAVTLALGIALMRLDLSGTWLARIAWPGDTDAAATMVQVVAAATMVQVVAAPVIAVTSLTFSLTVVALQPASQQFSPRLLRGFARDPVTRASLCVLVGTSVLAVTVLRWPTATGPGRRARSRCP